MSPALKGRILSTGTLEKPQHCFIFGEKNIQNTYMYLYVYTFVDKDWKGWTPPCQQKLPLRTGGDEGWAFSFYTS